MVAQLPSSFLSSIRKFSTYPENLVYKTAYSGDLETYRTRLDDIEKKLFVSENTEVNVPFRDVIGSGPTFDKLKIHDDAELQLRLGEGSKVSPVGSRCRNDPKCRFIFLYADNSIAPLKITREMLVRILSYYQVMPSYLDFVSVFGIHKHAREKRFSGFRGELRLTAEQTLPVQPLGRSGRQFQLCYNLKTIARWTEYRQLAPSSYHWTIRQGAVYHQFDVDNGTSLWLVTRAGLDIKQRIEAMTGKDGRSDDRQFQTPKQCLKSSLAVHLLLCHWSSENWRTYLQWLEESVEHETYGVVHGPRGHDQPQQKASSLHLQRAQILEEETTEAITVLKGNKDVFLSLRNFYQTLLQNDQSQIKDTCGSDLSLFTSHIDNFIYDSNMHIERGRLLAEIIASRKTVILQHLQSQATDKMEKLTTSMQRDSLTVRIIAYLTFLYLPGTFVSTFFSTDIVKYQDQNNPEANSTSFSAMALNRWLQVTLPLTFMTFVIATYWYRREDGKIKKANEDLSTTEVRFD